MIFYRYITLLGLAINSVNAIKSFSSITTFQIRPVEIELQSHEKVVCLALAREKLLQCSLNSIPHSNSLAKTLLPILN